MLETALRSQLISNSSIYALIGEHIYVGDTPAAFEYPFIRITGAGENPADYDIKNCMIESLAVDIFASHNPEADIYGYPDCAAIAKLIREQFDAFRPESWEDESDTYDVIKVEFRGHAYLVNKEYFDLQKPITLTIQYNIRS